MSEVLLEKTAKPERLLSLDFFRGAVMFLLIGESAHIFFFVINPEAEGTFWHSLGMQFHHHPWNGLRMWDLIQPAFMFIVGVSMPMSFRSRTLRGDSYALIRKHAIQRAGLLLLLGWALYCIGPGHITWRFHNVLSQLSVTYLITFFLLKYSLRTQLIASLVILAVTELLYRAAGISGFDQAFVADKNFGAYVDMLIAGELNGGHWVVFNALPTTAHTIWGAMVGVLLMSDRSKMEKLRILVVAGLIGVGLGYLMDPMTPIIKRIATSSFVVVSGGWTLLAFALSYWIIDVLNMKKGVLFFTVVGMNPLFIYLFAHIGGAGLVRKVIKPFSGAVFDHIEFIPTEAATNLIVWFALWYMCYWMYKKKIFIRI
ncbi:MAG: DUF5009 domain-containing protein [Verrucomicrobiota bacterium]